jgi:hypothetical protein
LTVKRAVVDPNVTEVAPEKPDPDSVTDPPPDVGPRWGTTEVTRGETKMYAAAGTTALVPPAVPPVLTVTGRVAAERTSGVTTVTEVGV